MPWWGWLVAASVVWFTLVGVGLYLFVLRKMLGAQRQMMADVDKPLNVGSPRQPDRVRRPNPYGVSDR